MTSSSRPTALVTHASGFGGPAAVIGLLGAGYHVIAHDRSFETEEPRDAYRDGREGLSFLSQETPEAVIDAAYAISPDLKVIVSNDFAPATAYTPEAAPIEALRENLDKLVEFPFRLVRAALPRLRDIGGGNVVMITSNRMRLPLSGGAFPDAARSAANALVQSLAVDCASAKVTVNAVAPNFLYSEQFYPKAVYEQTEEGRNYIAQQVPAGRLADPEEMGELIAFLAGAKSRHLTGAIIDFSGGWPAAPERPWA